MKLIQIKEVLDAQVAYGVANWESLSIETFFASDLMSDVLMSDRDEMLVITSLSSEQSIRSAGIVGAEAVVIAGDKSVSAGMLALAEELGVTVLCSRHPKYESCLLVGSLSEPL